MQRLLSKARKCNGRNRLHTHVGMDTALPFERIPSKKRIDQGHHVSTPRKAKLHMEWKVQRQAGLWQRGIEYHSPTKIAHPYISATSHCQDWPSKWSSWLCESYGCQVAYQDVRSAVKLKSLNRGWRTPDPSPTRDADAEKDAGATWK